MVIETSKQRDKKTFHLQSLIEGAFYRELEDDEMSKTVSLFLVSSPLEGLI